MIGLRIADCGLRTPRTSDAPVLVTRLRPAEQLCATGRRRRASRAAQSAIRNPEGDK